jgi:hypothetical protein
VQIVTGLRKQASCTTSSWAAATASALNDLPALALAWRFYLDNYVGWGLDGGVAPANVLASFPTLLSARAGDLRKLRAQGPPDQGSRWDSHPPVGQRIAMINAEPATDGRPATVLLDDFDAAVAELELIAFDLGDRTRMPLEQYTAAAAQALHQREADVLYRAAERVLATSGSGAVPAAKAGGLGAVLDLAEAGRAGELHAALFRSAALDDQEAVADGFRGYLAAAFSVALVDAGVARWRHSWSGPVALVDGRGDPAPVDELVARVVAGDVAAVRERLRRLGVDIRAAVAKEASATAVGADVLAGVVNLVVDGDRTDMLVLSSGLLLVPGVKRLQMRTAKRRLVEMATSVPPERLAAAPGNRFIPYEDIVHSRRTRRFPKTYELAMLDGPTITIRWGGEPEEIGEGFKAWDEAMALVAKADGAGQRP